MARSSKKSKGTKSKSKISAEPKETVESEEEVTVAQIKGETSRESKEDQELDEEATNTQRSSAESRDEIVAGIDEGQTLVEDATDSKPSSAKRPRYISELVLAVAVIVALIAGLLVGYQYGSFSSSPNPCGYGFSNATNSSLTDGIDAYQITAINASFSEINKTLGFCGNLTAQQQAFVNNIFR